MRETILFPNTPYEIRLMEAEWMAVGKTLVTDHMRSFLIVNTEFDVDVSKEQFCVIGGL